MAPPLRLVWSAPGRFGSVTLAAEGAAVVWSIDGTITCIGEDGTERWRRSMRFDGAHGIVSGRVVARGLADGSRLVEMDLEGGGIVRDTACDFSPCAFLPEEAAFIGVSERSVSGSRSTALAYVSLRDGATILWEVVSGEESGSSGEVLFGPEAACDGGRGFIARGDHLVAVDLRSGAEVWKTSVANLGPMARTVGCEPMVCKGRVVIRTPGKIEAFDTATGGRVWRSSQYGPRFVYGDRVYLCTLEGVYCSIDMESGRPLLEVDLKPLFWRKWGMENIYPATDLIVSETHAFIGDGRGRLFAFDRDTGEPVWYHRPRGTNGYFGAQPAVAGNRLFLTTAGNPRKDGALYCYESD